MWTHPRPRRRRATSPSAPAGRRANAPRAPRAEDCVTPREPTEVRGVSNPTRCLLNLAGLTRTFRNLRSILMTLVSTAAFRTTVDIDFIGDFAKTSCRGKLFLRRDSPPRALRRPQTRREFLVDGLGLVGAAHLRERRAQIPQRALAVRVRRRPRSEAPPRRAAEPVATPSPRRAPERSFLDARRGEAARAGRDATRTSPMNGCPQWPHVLSARKYASSPSLNLTTALAARRGSRSISGRRRPRRRLRHVLVALLPRAPRARTRQHVARPRAAARQRDILDPRRVEHSYMMASSTRADGI